MLNDVEFLDDDDDLPALDFIFNGLPRQVYIRNNYFDTYDEASYRKRFRLSKNCTLELLVLIEDRLEFPYDGNNCVSPINQLLVCLRYYSTGGHLQTIADFAGMHLSTVSRIIVRVSEAIASLHNQYIRLENANEYIRKTQQQFFDVAAFPRVLGVIDCTHIKLQSPGGDDAEVFRNRKRYFSLNVQMVCDSKLIIQNVVARWPGSSHDATIFTHSNLRRQFENRLFPNCLLLGNRGLEAPYAVLVFTHGESFEWGSGNPYDGSVLASYGHVIVVTLNFRLGILGFLRTRPGFDKSDSSGGNLGIKDIAAALRWIKTNIPSFGGDPKRVTLIGHDTGAALVNFLLVSPNSKGLFHRVVLLSGTALSPWATIHNPDNIRISVGHQTGCLSSTESEDEDIAPCLRSRPVQALLDVHMEIVRFMPRIAPSLPVDSETPDPTYAMEHASENFITCEVMLGTTTTESYNDFSATDIQYGFEEEERNRVLRTYIRNAYVYHLNEIFSAVRNEYTDWDKPIQHPINIRDSTMEALSDGHTVSPLIRVGYLHARRGAKTYFFHFGYQTKDSDYPQRLGSVRGEDITYILGMPLVGGMPFFPQNFSRQDMGVAEAVLNFFSNFAKSGDPNGPGVHKDIPDYGTYKEKTRYRGLTWEPYEIGTQLYLSVALKPKMKSHYRGHKMAVWLNLIPQLHQPGDDDVSMRHHHFHEREQYYYAGPVRPESFTRLPPALHPASIADPHLSARDSTECIPNTTTDEDLVDVDVVIDGDEDESELLQRLATRHYYSYTTALGVTVGVGCLLLVLNMLIFAGIYYQRDRDRRRKNRASRSSSSPSTENISMSQRPATPVGSSRPQSPVGQCEKQELPPCYTMASKNANLPDPPPPPKQNTLQRKNKTDKPMPPMRTSSNPPGGTMKKRVQIQEISV